MCFDYNDIVRQYYEDLKMPFLNTLRKEYNLDYDEIMDIYADVWLALHDNIKRGKVTPDTKWLPLILQMGRNQANNKVTRRKDVNCLDDEKFNRDEFERKYTADQEEEDSIYEDPEFKKVLAAQLSYIPDPCNKVLKFFYYDEMSMKEIAVAMNYSGPDSAKTVRYRCMERLKSRILDAVRHLGILD